MKHTASILSSSTTILVLCLAVSAAPQLPDEILLGLPFISQPNDQRTLTMEQARDVRIMEFLSYSSRVTWTYDFSDPDPVSSGVLIAAPAGHLLGQFSSGHGVPGDTSTYALSDGVGATAVLMKGQGATVYFPAQRVESNSALVRVSVWATDVGAQVGLGALDSDQAAGLDGVDGSIATRILANSETLQGGWHQLVLFIDSYRESIVPVVQVVSDGDAIQTVFLDNLEILTPIDWVQEPSAQSPDLAVTGLTLVPETLWPNDETRIAAIVANTGEAFAESILVRFLVDGEEFASRTITRLEPGRDVTVDATWAAAGAGDHIVQAQVDPAGTIQEKDEGNNTLRRVISVEGSPKPMPDLLVGEFRVTTRDATAAETETLLQASIENIGNRTTEEVEVLFQFADGSERRYFIGQVASAGAEIAIITDTIPAPDMYPLVVTVDPENRIEELVEDNNRMTTFQPLEPVEDPVDTPNVPGPLRRMWLFLQERGFDSGEIPEGFWPRAVQHKQQMRSPNPAEYDPGGTAPEGDFPVSIHSDEGIELAVSAVGDPGAPSLLGNVGPFVNVEARNSFGSATLKIGLTPENARDIDPITLHLFYYHRPSKSFQLVHPSGLGNDGTYVWGQISEPGIYAVFGLPRDQARLALFKSLREMQPLSAMYREITGQQEPRIDNETTRLALTGDSQMSAALTDPLQMDLLGFPDLVGNAQLLEGDIFGEIPRDEKGHPIGSRPVVDTSVPGTGIDTLPGARQAGDYLIPDLSVSGDHLPEYQILDEIGSIGAKGIPVATPARGGNWQSVGPTNLAGRVKALAIHP
ncbi:MAG TPA: CARDB domain-containing protein, partial [bacterium]|nr:CARDB domain-containing protein [bacterium]